MFTKIYITTIIYGKELQQDQFSKIIILKSIVVG